jgi:hypothetical protein
MVLKRILPPQNDRRGKWTPNYEGPFVVKKVFSGGALLLMTMDGEDFPSPVNVDAVRRYFVEKKKKRDPLDKKNKESRQKWASRRTKNRKKRFGQKLGIK